LRWNERVCEKNVFQTIGKNLSKMVGAKFPENGTRCAALVAEIGMTKFIFERETN